MRSPHHHRAVALPYRRQFRRHSGGSLHYSSASLFQRFTSNSPLSTSRSKIFRPTSCKSPAFKDFFDSGFREPCIYQLANISSLMVSAAGHLRCAGTPSATSTTSGALAHRTTRNRARGTRPASTCATAATSSAASTTSLEVSSPDASVRNAPLSPFRRCNSRPRTSLVPSLRPARSFLLRVCASDGVSCPFPLHVLG